MLHILLDSTPLGLLSMPLVSSRTVAISNWATQMLAAGHSIYLPEVIDYEIRRELVRARKTAGIAKLESLRTTVLYLPITTDAMRLAAELWARSRQTGQPTGDPKKLDIDSILAGQALTMGIPESKIMIATSNVGHFSEFAPAGLWQNILP